MGPKWNPFGQEAFAMTFPLNIVKMMVYVRVTIPIQLMDMMYDAVAEILVDMVPTYVFYPID